MECFDSFYNYRFSCNVSRNGSCIEYRAYFGDKLTANELSKAKY